MQAVILAAGRGKRMGALTDHTPKPMLEVGKKNLIQHKLEILPDSVTEVILVIGYLGEKIMEFFGDSYNGKKISYVWQKELKGTGHALWQTKHLIKGKFIVMMGDDLYSREDIEECVKHDWSILVKKHETGTHAGGRVMLNNTGVVTEIIEGEHTGENILISTALYVLQPHIFSYELVQIPGREEWGLPQTLVQAVKDFDIRVITSKFWVQLTDAQDIAKADQAVFI